MLSWPRRRFYIQRALFKKTRLCASIKFSFGKLLLVDFSNAQAGACCIFLDKFGLLFGLANFETGLYQPFQGKEKGSIIFINNYDTVMSTVSFNSVRNWQNSVLQHQQSQVS